MRIDHQRLACKDLRSKTFGGRPPLALGIPETGHDEPILYLALEGALIASVLTI